jgi:hypothetical protein
MSTRDMVPSRWSSPPSGARHVLLRGRRVPRAYHAGRYLGNAVMFGKAEATVGEIEEKGLGWTAWLLNRAVASFDEARRARGRSLEHWVGPGAGLHVLGQPGGCMVYIRSDNVSCWNT